MTRLLGRLRRGLGLRARMTASYVVVTFAAVILVEGLSAALVVPNLNAQADLSSRVLATASDYSTRFGQVLQQVALSSPDLDSQQAQQQVMQLYQSAHVGEPNAGLRPGQERHLDKGVLIPDVSGQLPDSAPMSLAVILGPDGTIYGSSYPERYPQGTTATAWLPNGWVGGGGQSRSGHQEEASEAGSHAGITSVSIMMRWPGRRKPEPVAARRGGESGGSPIQKPRRPPAVRRGGRSRIELCGT